MNLPPHISKIGLFTGQMYLVGAVCHIYKSYGLSDPCKKQTNLAIICSSVYATTMVHWYNMKPSGIAKTVDMITVVASALFISFHESYKWNRGRELWNSVLLLGGVTYVVNTAILTVPLFPSIDIEKLQMITTVAHTFLLHIMPNLTVIWSVWSDSF
jgi:predicted membrane chloride channel (bestrophin family)